MFIRLTCLLAIKHDYSYQEVNNKHNRFNTSFFIKYNHAPIYFVILNYINLIK